MGNLVSFSFSKRSYFSFDFCCYLTIIGMVCSSPVKMFSSQSIIFFKAQNLTGIGEAIQKRRYPEEGDRNRNTFMEKMVQRY